MYNSGGFLVIAICGNTKQRRNHESGGFMLQGMQQLFVIAFVKVIWHNETWDQYIDLLCAYACGYEQIDSKQFDGVEIMKFYYEEHKTLH